MSFFALIIIAIVEAMDCFAVSIASGLSQAKTAFSRVLLLAFSFGFFQGGMTLLGYFLGSFASHWVSSFGHFIACAILSFLGIRMVLGAFKKEDEKIKTLTIKNILLYAVATSIDAFAVGVSFAFVAVNLVFAVTAIACASFLLGFIGFELGKHAAQKFETKIPEILAGIILMGIGIKMLF